MSIRGARTWALVALRATWPFLLVTLVFVSVGGVGFSPTDEGLIQAGAQRILRGEIPHLDVISPRPLGSAYLHTIDLLLPTPLVATSRFIGLCEIAAYTALLASLAFRRGPLKWSVIQCLLVATAILVNIHTFPVTAWHTIDGLLLTSAGFVALAVGMARRRQLVVDLAMVLLGAAIVVKQSFAPGVALGLLWIALDARPSIGVGTRRVVRGVIAAAIPGAAYTLVVLAGGALGRMWIQLTSGGGQVAHQIESELDRAGDAADTLFFAACVALIVLVITDRVSRRVSAPVAPAARVCGLAARVVLTVAVIEIVVSSRLELYGAWGTLLLGLLLLVVAWRAAAGDGIDGIALLTLAVGAMAMLSWGYAVPDLVGGSLALVVVHRAWHGIDLSAIWLPRVAVAGGAAAAIVFIVIAGVVHDERTYNVYRHPTGEELTVDLGTIDDDFAGITSNAGIAAYLRQARDCVERFPASRVALLPDNAMLSPAFGLENPLPNDWMWGSELADSTTAILQAAERVGREGDYLVLFETTPAHSAAYIGVPRHVPPDAPIYFYLSGLGEDIRNRLPGERITCGSFVGVYSPPPGREKPSA